MSSADKWERNQTDIRGDGRVVIYQRPRRDGTINPTWHMRLLLPNQSGYFRASTRSSNNADASRIALNKFDEFQVRALSGSSVRQIRFSQAYEEWKKAYPNTQSRSRPLEYIHTAIGVLGKYPYTYFVEACDDLPIESIDDKSVGDFYIWRRQNSFRNGKPFIPADDTLRKEMNLIGSLLNYAHQRKYIKEVPSLSPPNVDDNRRPAFTADEWKKLYTAARSWVKQAKHPSVERDRFYLQHYILVLCNSGIRVGEARELRWGNISTIKTSSGNQTVLSVIGKTKERDVVSNPNTRRYLQRIYDWRKAELGRAPDAAEYVFCHANGDAVGSYKKSFASLLEFAGLTFNSRGQKHTPYSLRHTYATFKLDEVSVYFVAKNMGTSVGMIERFYGQTRTREQAEALVKNAPRPAETKDSQSKSYPF